MCLRSILVNAVVPFGVGDRIGRVFKQEGAIIERDTHFVSGVRRSPYLSLRDEGLSFGFTSEKPCAGLESVDLATIRLIFRRRDDLRLGYVRENMTRAEKDEVREERIEMRIIVDAYTRDEQAYGWHAYLDDMMEFPFEARCISEREESPLKEGESVRVIGMSSAEPTLSQQYVTVEWMDRELGIPLQQLEPIDVNDETKQAVEDWRYWLGR